MRLDLAVDGTMPTWSAGSAMDKQDWGDVHLAQGGRVTGTVEVDGHMVTLDGYSVHTPWPAGLHQPGPPPLVLGVLPSGRMCLAVAALQASGEDLAMGLVTQDGGLVAAEAIVARGLGLPCVMNTGSGTTTLHTGDICRVDGTTGVVEVLSSVLPRTRDGEGRGREE